MSSPNSRGEALARRRLPINAHVIHQHNLRKNGGVVRRAGPVATYRDVQNYKKRVVVNPLCSLRQIGRSSGSVKIAVHVKPDYVRLPFHGIKMIVIREAALA